MRFPFRRIPLEWWIYAALALLVLAGILLDQPLCPWRRFLGIRCPGCGMTRAFLALARGDWAAALHFHPLSPLAALVLLGLALRRLWPRRPTGGLDPDSMPGGQPVPPPEN